MTIKKTFLLLLFTISLSGYALSAQPDLTDEQINKYVENINQKQVFIADFIITADYWDNGILSQKFELLTELYEAIQKSFREFKKGNIINSDMLASTLHLYDEQYNQLKYAYDVLNTLTQRKREWEDTYFSLWTQVNIKNAQVNDMYTSQVKSNAASSLGINEESSLVKKPAIYYSYQECYKYLISALKAEREYRFRIPIEEKLLVLSEKVILLKNRKTRDLEKKLRRENNPDLLYNLIVNF